LIPLNKGLFPNQNSSRAELVVINMMEKMRSVTFDKKDFLIRCEIPDTNRNKGIKSEDSPKASNNPPDKWAPTMPNRL
jgi:oxalate decarboxylase/phosphoglucose isomerase-like protein (cupin superfamily)